MTDTDLGGTKECTEIYSTRGVFFFGAYHRILFVVSIVLM